MLWEFIVTSTPHGCLLNCDLSDTVGFTPHICKGNRDEDCSVRHDEPWVNLYGTGWPLGEAQAPHPLRHRACEDSDSHPAWPTMAETVLEAVNRISNIGPLLSLYPSSAIMVPGYRQSRATPGRRAPGGRAGQTR